MKRVYIAIPLIIIVFIISVFGVIIQLRTQSIATDLAVDKVGDLGDIDYYDGIRGHDGGVATLYSSDNQEHISVYSNNFEEYQEYQGNRTMRFIYMDNTMVLLGTQYLVGKISDLTATYRLEFQHINTLNGSIYRTQYNFSHSLDPEINYAAIFLYQDQAKILQDRLYIPFSHTGNRTLRYWGVLEIDRQTLDGRIYSLGTTESGLQDILLQSRDHHLQIIPVIRSSRNLTIYNFDPSTMNLELNREVDLDCSFTCFYLLSGNDELLVVDYISANIDDRTEFEINRENRDMIHYVRIEKSLQVKDIRFVDPYYLALTFEDNNEDHEWFYLLDIEQREFIRLPSNPAGFGTWDTIVIDELVSDELILLIQSDRDAFLYSYQFSIAKTIDRITRIAWILPVGGSIVVTGLIWMVIRVLRGQQGGKQVELYPKIDHKTNQKYQK